jgi:hypothetical protein
MEFSGVRQRHYEAKKTRRKGIDKAEEEEEEKEKEENER